MGLAGQQPPYIGQSRILAHLPPLLLMQRQGTEKRQNKQLRFRGKHVSSLFSCLENFAWARTRVRVCVYVLRVP